MPLTNSVGKFVIAGSVQYAAILLRPVTALLLLAIAAPLTRCATGASQPDLSILPSPPALSVRAVELANAAQLIDPQPGLTGAVGAVTTQGELVLSPGRATAAAAYAVRGQYRQRALPYLAPVELSFSSRGGSVWLALFDHEARRWKLHAGPLQSGAHRLAVGVEPNAADDAGVFHFALLATGQQATVSNIKLRYPDAPTGGGPVHYQLMVHARDGTPLATDLYLPDNSRGPFSVQPPYPVLLVRTPYEKEYVGGEYISWVSRFKVAVVIQYYRGRPEKSPDSLGRPASGGSPGLFDDHAGPEHFDAVDTVAWIKARSFSNGKLLFIGASALGMWAYQALPAVGDDVTAMYGMAAAGDVGAWAAMQNGCYKLGNVDGWLKSFNFPPETLRRVRAEATNAAQWERADFNNVAVQARAPGWHETGWWDVDVEETIRSFRALHERGGDGARGRQWIVIGPWTHEGIRKPLAGEMSFGYSSVEQNPSLLPFSWEGALWGAYHLNRNPFYTPPEEHARVYFVGEQGNRTAPNNTWYSLPTWPPPYKGQTLHIVNGQLSTQSPSKDWSVRFDCDPHNPIPTLGGANLPLSDQSVGPMDQRPVQSNAGVIKLRGEPLASRLSTAGPFTAKLFVSTDAADSDVIVKLLDVYPDGRAMLIADRALRLSWWCQQRGLGKVQPGRVYEIELTVGERAWVFERGHRIGIDVQASNYPRFDVNPGTGAALSGGRMVVQHNTLHSGPQHPSRFELPLYAPE